MLTFSVRFYSRGQRALNTATTNMRRLCDRFSEKTLKRVYHLLMTAGIFG